MNGTVLNIANGAGIILDEQGNRYTFGHEDVKSGALRNGSKVDFLNENGKAKEIYLLSGGNPMAGATDAMISINENINKLTGGSKLKQTVYIAVIGVFLSIVGFIFSDFITLVGLGLELYAVHQLATYKNDMSFFWYKVKTVVALAVGMWLAGYGFTSIMTGAFMGNVGFGVFVLMLGIAVLIYAVFTTIKAYNGIGRAYNSKLFYLVAKLYIAIPAVLITLAVFSIVSVANDGGFGILTVINDLSHLGQIASFLWAGWSALLIAAYLKIDENAVVVANQFTPTQPKQEVAVCPSCHTENPIGAKFCSSCGGSIAKPATVETPAKVEVPHEPKCSICGKVYTDGSKFCEEDGGQIL